MGKEKIEEKDVRLLRYAVEQAFDGAMRDGALALLNRLVDSASEAANLEEELLNLKGEYQRSMENSKRGASEPRTPNPDGLHEPARAAACGAKDHIHVVCGATLSRGEPTVVHCRRTPFQDEKGSALPFCSKSREVPPPMGKQYAILRVQKCKGAEVGAMQYHNDREPGKHTNPDIDQSRTRMNRELCPHADYEGEVQARIDAGYRGTRKVRKDAVRLVEGIVTASPEFFEGASAEEVRDFFEDALGFCREEFGESNLVHFTVHMDEETPHAHFGFVPLKDGKLSWKGFFPDKAALGAMQDRFHGRVGALYGLSRGEKRLEGQPARRHKSVAEYKAESRRVQSELDEKAEQLEAAREELASTRAQLAECRSQVEGFAARFERIKAELAQIAECLSVRGFLGSFKAKLAEFAENPICKAALAAGRDFMTARDGRRAEKVLVDGAREKVGEMGELSREMDEWSLSDEAGDMRGARRELDGHEAPARPLDNQVL